MSNRVVLVSVGILFSIYCLTVAILSFIGLNLATFHLSTFLIAGYAAIYGVLSPIGLSGILGGLHRKKSLIKGFMFQYWFASGLMIGINVANVILSDKLRANAIRKCQSALFGVVSDGQNTLNLCTNKVQKSEGVALIFASVQGAALILIGFLVLFFGIKEFKDIVLEEETRSLLEKAKFQEDSRNSLSDNESNASGSNNANSNAADGGRYPVSASVSRASSRSDHGRFTQNTVSMNVSREPSSRSDRERYTQKVKAVPASYAGLNRPQTPGASFPYSTPANNVSNSRINVNTNRGAPPGKYQPPPGHYRPTTPKNAYPAPNKNNNYVSTSSKNNYPPSSNKSNYPSSSKNNYPSSNKNNSSPINGSNRPGQNLPNAKLLNYSSSQPLPLPVTSPERSYATDRYGPQASNSNSYSAPIANYAGKSSMRKPMMPPSSNRNYPPSTRPPANANYYPPPVSANRSQQKIQKGYQASGNDYDYTNDYNDYIIPSDTYITYAQPR